MTPKDNAKWLHTLLDMPRQIVGVHFLLSKEDYDSFPAPELENKMTYCTMVRRATTGLSQKAHAGHMACMGGANAMGIEAVSEEANSGERRLARGGYQDLCVSRKVSRNMAYCQHRAYGVAVMPLKDCPRDPDVVVAICNPYNAMRLMQSYGYRHAQAQNVQLVGMAAVCQECTSLPYERDQINVSMLCAGTRMIARWGKDEMGVGMPYHLFKEMVVGLKETVNPFERDADKDRIIKRLEEEQLSDSFTVIKGRNYDDGCYIGGPIGSPTKK